MHSHSRASMASAFSNRVLILNVSLGRSKGSVGIFLKHLNAIFMRGLISRVRSASSVMRPPRYTNWWTWLYFWPAAMISSAGRGRVGAFPSCRTFSGIFFFDTVKPNAPNTYTITVIILASPAGVLDTIPASSAYSISHIALRTRSSRVSSERPPFLRRGIPGPSEWCRLRGNAVVPPLSPLRRRC